MIDERFKKKVSKRKSILVIPVGGTSYTEVAKNIGDKRAIVAEQAFGKPFAKVTVAKCGVLQDAPPPPAVEEEASSAEESPPAPAEEAASAAE